jgi:hypothetical protein
LGARCDSADIGEAVCNCFVERHQKTAGRLLTPNFQKAKKPSLQAVIRIIALASDEGVEIRKLIGIVVEWMQQSGVDPGERAEMAQVGLQGRLVVEDEDCPTEAPFFPAKA